MALKGDKKRDYQRGYMRKRRATLRLNRGAVRPPVRPTLDADGNPLPDYE